MLAIQRIWHPKEKIPPFHFGVSTGCYLGLRELAGEPCLPSDPRRACLGRIVVFRVYTSELIRNAYYKILPQIY